MGQKLDCPLKSLDPVIITFPTATTGTISLPIAPLAPMCIERKLQKEKLSWAPAKD